MTIKGSHKTSPLLFLSEIENVKRIPFEIMLLTMSSKKMFKYLKNFSKCQSLLQEALQMW